jgi:hypothetical protein
MHGITARWLTALYPPAVRERWGAELSRAVAEAGVRAWPDTVVGAVRLWLHPAEWPETSAGQTRRVMTVTMFALTAATGLLLRTVSPSATLTADLGHPATSLWLAPLLLGIALAVPLPPLRGLALRRLTAVAARTLAAPALAVLGMFLLAWTGVPEMVGTGLAAALVSSYWLTLGFVALRLCTLVARITRTAAPPSARRLSSAFLSVGAGLAFGASQSLLAGHGATAPPRSLIDTAALGVLAVTALSVGNNLRQPGTRAAG